MSAGRFCGGHDIVRDGAHPLGILAASDLHRLGISTLAFALCRWNFTKFLIGKNGDVVGRYGSTTTPDAIEKDIVKALEA